MTTKQENEFNLKVGDVIEYYENNIYVVARFNEKSVWTKRNGNGYEFRESWNTLNGHIKYFNAKISRI